MAHDSEAIRTGTLVEVWNRPLGRFRGSYQVTAAGPSGVRVQPTSERTPLPGLFSYEEIRPVRDRRTDRA